MDCSMPDSSVLHYLPKFAQIHVHWVGDAIWSSHPLPSPLLLPSVFPGIRVLFNESALHIRWSKYWSFSNSPSNWYSDLMSFRIDWFDFLAIQGTLKSLLQHHNLKHQFFGAQTFRWSNSYILTWLVKNHSFDYTDLCRHHLAKWCLCFLICFFIHF